MSLQTEHSQIRIEIDSLSGEERARIKHFLSDTNGRV